jgi:hypothetical protein
MLDGAEGALPGAFVAQNHEGGCPATPAFTKIGTSGAPAYGVQVLLDQESLDSGKVFTAAQIAFKPLRQMLSIPSIRLFV